MSSLKGDGLKKIYLFKSADFQFAEIDLSDNTLLLGESGVGKTTLMRAILFFYTMSYKASVLNINTESKKSFIQWYFKERNSHLVYEYQKDGSQFLFIVSNSGNLHYTFVDISNSNLTVKDLLLEGREPVILEKLNENIERYRLPMYHTTQQDKYIRAFHKKDIENKKIKQESKTSFVLFEDITSRQEFAKILSHIFATSKVSSDSVKKTIVSLIDDTTASIDLKEIKNSLSEYVEFRNQIKRFEKQIPKINELKGAIYEYKENKTSFKESANQINLLKSQSDFKLTEIGMKLEKLEKREKDLNLEYQPKINSFKNDISKKNKVIVIESNDIEKSKKKRDFYQSKNIDNLVSEYRGKKTYEDTLEQYESRYKALTSNADEVNEVYIKIFQKLEKDKDDTILAVRSDNMIEIQKITAKKMEVMEEESIFIGSETYNLEEEKQKLKIDLKEQNRVFGEIRISQAKVINYPYNNENIERFLKEIGKFKDEIALLNPQIVELKSEIESIEKKIESIAIKLLEAKEKLLGKIGKKKNLLFENQKAIEIKLDFDKENLYGYINKNSIENRDKLLTYLKDEVLFSENKFSIKKADNSTSIFGLDIDFIDENFGVDYDEVSLVSQLEFIKTQLKKENEELRIENITLDDNATKETIKLDRLRTKLAKEENRKVLKVKSHEANKIISENSLTEAKKVADSERKEVTKKLTKQYLQQEESIHILEENMKNISSKITNISTQIKANTKSAIKKLDDKLELLIQDENKVIEELKEQYVKDLDKSKDELTNRLEQKGVDKKVLEEIDANIEKYGSKIKFIEENETDVRVYLSEYEEDIKRIPLRESALLKEESLLVNLQIKSDDLKDELKLKIEVIFEERESLGIIKISLDDFIKKYNKQISNQPIENDIKNILSLNYDKDVSELLDNKETLSMIIDRLIIDYSKLDNNRSIIISKTQRATKGLDKSNIFKLDIVDDYIEASDNVDTYLSVANGLVSYVENDKIFILKETSSAKFKNHLNSIQKYIKIFDEAIMDIETKVTKLGNRVNKAVESFNVIDSIQIRQSDANSHILEKLKLVIGFYSQNSEKLLLGLFPNNENRDENRKVQDELGYKIEELVTLLASSKEYLYLQEGFVLDFRVSENGNSLPPAQTLNDIGSNGTSTLVKAIINISILQMVNKNSQVINHCILDEIGTISPTYFKELKDYANSSGFLFVNGMPTEDDILISMYPTIYVGQKYGKDSRMLPASKMVI
jgi:hypothetical protein